MNKTERVQKSLALGRRRFVLTRGVLGWGMASATMFAVFNLLRLPHPQIKDVVIPFIVFPVAGLYWGVASWIYLQKQAAASAAKERRV